MNNYDEEADPFLEQNQKIDYCWLICYSLMISIYSCIASFILFEFANKQKRLISNKSIYLLISFNDRYYYYYGDLCKITLNYSYFSAIGFIFVAVIRFIFIILIIISSQLFKKYYYILYLYDSKIKLIEIMAAILFFIFSFSILMVKEYCGDLQLILLLMTGATSMIAIHFCCEEIDDNNDIFDESYYRLWW